MNPRQQEIVIKTSPVVFLKRLVIIEFLFAIGTTLISVSINLPGIYATSPLVSLASFGLIAGVFVTSIQILIVAAAFTTWYFDTYRVSKLKIMHWHASVFGERTIAQTQAVTGIKVVQSAVGHKLNYGTLKLTLLNAGRKSHLRNVPNPHHYAALIQKLIAPQQIDITKQLQIPVPEMISDGEGQYLEFKSSFSWDYRRNSVNKGLNKAVMKNIVGFMNTTGGVILMGVDDKGEILGLEKEFQSQGKPNVDGFENSFNVAFNNMIGAEYRHYIKLDFATIKDSTVARVAVIPAPEPVYLRLKNGEEFYIRTGNSSQPLSISKAVKYIQSHFEN